MNNVNYTAPITKPRFNSIHLPIIRHEPIIIRPFGWLSQVDQATITKTQLSVVNTSGAWFLTRLTPDISGEPLCIGDALRFHLINTTAHTCCRTIDPSFHLPWQEAASKGWLTHQAVRELMDSYEFSYIAANGNEIKSTSSITTLINQIGTSQPFLEPVLGVLGPMKITIAEAYQNHKLSQRSFERVAGVLASGICVTVAEADICWVEVGSSERPPCLTDWLSSSAFNTVSRKLRMYTIDKTTPSLPKFVERELTVKEAINMGLLDDSRRELIMKRTDKNSLAVRITLREAIARHLVNTDELSSRLSRKDHRIPIEVLHAAGWLSRPLSVAELLLSGRWRSDGVLDTELGRPIPLTQAIASGIVDDTDISLYFPRDSAPCTLQDAMQRRLVSPDGEILSEDGTIIPLWDAVNLNLVRLIYTETCPPILGPINKTNLPTAQHSLMGVLNLENHEIVKIVDPHTAKLLFSPCGLKAEDGMRLTGWQALSRGLLKPASRSHLIGSVAGALNQAQICDLLSPQGAHLLQSLSPFRPPLGFTSLRRVITHLAWIGPGMDFSSFSPRSLPDRLIQAQKQEVISAVLDPITGRRLTSSEAVKRGVLDLVKGFYYDPKNQQTLSISEAISQQRIIAEDAETSVSL